MLKLNSDKTEFMILGNPSKRPLLANWFRIELLGSMFCPAQKVRNLGVLFDSDLSLSDQVSSVVRSCFYHLRDLSRIRRNVSKSVATTLANALVSSRLDNGNSVLFGLPEKQLNIVQSIQNILCRIVARLPRGSHVTETKKSYTGCQ